MMTTSDIAQNFTSILNGTSFQGGQVALVAAMYAWLDDLKSGKLVVIEADRLAALEKPSGAGGNDE